MSKAFDKIAAGLADVLAVARGEKDAVRIYVPPEIDVRGIREKTGLSQDGFASTFGFSVHQIRQWEQGRCRPLGAVRAYLLVIDRDPVAIMQLLRSAVSKGKKAA